MEAEFFTLRPASCLYGSGHPWSWEGIFIRAADPSSHLEGHYPPSHLPALSSHLLSGEAGETSQTQRLPRSDSWQAIHYLGECEKVTSSLWTPVVSSAKSQGPVSKCQALFTILRVQMEGNGGKEIPSNLPGIMPSVGGKLRLQINKASSQVHDLDPQSHVRGT